MPGFRIERDGETITLSLPSPGGGQLAAEMDWIRAAGLAASLEGHAEQARRRVWRRENRCVECGTQLEPGHPGETCGDECPTEAVR